MFGSACRVGAAKSRRRLPAPATRCRARRRPFPPPRRRRSPRSRLTDRGRATSASIYAATRRAADRGRRRAGARAISVARRRLQSSPPPTRARRVALLRLCPAGHRAGRARTRRRALPRRRAHRPALEVARRPGDDRLRHVRRSRRRCWRCCSPIGGWRSDVRASIDGSTTRSGAARRLSRRARRAARRQGARRWRTALADTVRTTSCRAAFCTRAPARCATSIAAEVAADGDGVVATVGSFGDVKYAAIQEYGGKTAAHEILPVKGEGARLRRRRRDALRARGSSIPARSFPSAPICARRSTR